MEEIQAALTRVIQEVFKVDVQPVLTRPDEQFGDYATNVALQLAGKVGKPPRDIATQLVEKVSAALPDHVEAVAIAGPGFLNFRLKDQTLLHMLTVRPAKTLVGQKVVVELSSPNPFKDFHIGHVYNNVVGEALANLQEAGGATVHRVSYHGDVGMHIAMAIWGLQNKTGGNPQKMEAVPEEDRPRFLGEAYALGANAYKDDAAVQQDIKAINAKIYDASDATVNAFYNTGRSWSFAYFDTIYVKLGSSIEKKYFESDAGPRGLGIVREHLADGVFENSDGAVVYKGEKAGLHTRVFINKQGLPTYEAKDLGLTMLKWEDYHYDRSIIVTANEINEYFKVVLAALGEIDQGLAAKTAHLSHGVVKLTTGKMSSRTGQVLSAVQVLEMVRQAVQETTNGDAKTLDDSAIGAIKYAFLKQRVGGDIIFDIQESVALEGNSGPYLQYAHARARSILAKAGEHKSDAMTTLEPGERSLARKISEYPAVTQLAVAELMPHHICTYLYELAQTFNRFYEHNRVVGDPREGVRVQLVAQYAVVLKDGLHLLGIAAPEHM